ncbi:MAG: hypothetical protein AAF226_17420, partial [Verrucomicrobiota bacterium]
MEVNNSRRSFAKTALLSALAPVGISQLASSKEISDRFEFCTFTKPFQHMTFDQLAESMAAIGLDGIECPVRPKGHIEPENVADQLPKMIEALKKNGLDMTILTSGINSIDPKQNTEQVLKTASDLGVKRFRMAYYRYNLDKPLLPQIDEFKAQLKDLVAMTDEMGIKP